MTNVDKMKLVHDVRSDHRNKLHNIMHSMLTRVPLETEPVDDSHAKDLYSLSPASILPNKDDVNSIKNTLKILVGHILGMYIDCLKPLAKVVPARISHPYSDNMALRSETFFFKRSH